MRSGKGSGTSISILFYGIGSQRISWYNQFMNKKNALKLGRDYVNFLVSNRYYNVKEAFLFGSYTRGRFNDDSDIDIALVLAGYKDTIKELSNLMRLRRNFDLRIEPHPITEEDFKSGNPFAVEIKKGVKIL
jgi:predicted nucleotidyltransferase